jgi:hypothetical protein
VLAPFRHRGTGDSTLYRWYDQLIKSGRPVQHLAHKAEEAAAARAVRTDDPAGERESELRAVLPLPARIEHATGEPTRNVMQRLGKVTADVEMMVEHCKTMARGGQSRTC